MFIWWCAVIYLYYLALPRCITRYTKLVHVKHEATSLHTGSQKCSLRMCTIVFSKWGHPSKTSGPTGGQTKSDDQELGRVGPKQDVHLWWFWANILNFILQRHHPRPPPSTVVRIPKYVAFRTVLHDTVRTSVAGGGGWVSSKRTILDRGGPKIVARTSLMDDP